MNLTKGQKMLMGFEYDFAKQGGTIGEIALPQLAGALPLGARIINAHAVAEEALTSAGTPTVQFGITSDPDRYIADSYTGLSTTLKYAEGVNLKLIGLATDIPVMTIGVADVTAGKVILYLEILV